MVTTGRRYTFADLGELPDDDHIYDILGGELVVRNAPDIAHGTLLTALIGLLFTAQQAGLGRAFTSTVAVALDYPERGEAALDVNHPDLVFVRREREAIIGDRAIEGVPDLIIEILSPSTRGEHAPHGKLRDAYERNGVPHYWLVDPGRRQLHQYQLTGEPYTPGQYGPPTVLRSNDIVRSPLFPEHAVSMAQLFQHVRTGRRRSPNAHQGELSTG